ncbi:MAG: hypothetical protein NZO16_08035 [Deltaproteobacteria bacterium]|nr:hypothetical protein [Deltaproteobacteria bacterium]
MRLFQPSPLFNLKVELDSVNAIIADKANKGLPKKETEVIFKRVFDALNQEKGATKNTQLTSSPIYGWLIWLFSGSFVLGFLVYESVSMMKEVEAIMKWKNKGKSILSFGSKLCVKLFHQHSLRVSWFWGHNATIA